MNYESVESLQASWQRAFDRRFKARAAVQSAVAELELLRDELSQAEARLFFLEAKLQRAKERTALK